MGIIKILKKPASPTHGEPEVEAIETASIVQNDSGTLEYGVWEDSDNKFFTIFIKNPGTSNQEVSISDFPDIDSLYQYEIETLILNENVLPLYSRTAGEVGRFKLAVGDYRKSHFLPAHKLDLLVEALAEILKKAESEGVKPVTIERRGGIKKSAENNRSCGIRPPDPELTDIVRAEAHALLRTDNLTKFDLFKICAHQMINFYSDNWHNLYNANYLVAIYRNAGFEPENGYYIVGANRVTGEKEFFMATVSSLVKSEMHNIEKNWKIKFKNTCFIIKEKDSSTESKAAKTTLFNRETNSRYSDYDDYDDYGCSNYQNFSVYSSSAAKVIETATKALRMEFV